MKDELTDCKLVLPIKYANIIYSFDELDDESQSKVLRYMETLKTKQIKKAEPSVKKKRRTNGYGKKEQV